MTAPVTARLDDEAIAAIDEAIKAGLAPSRSALVAEAVRDWLRRNGEQGIIDSYRRRYQDTDAVSEATVADLAAFSVAACLASER